MTGTLEADGVLTAPRPRRSRRRLGLVLGAVILLVGGGIGTAVVVSRSSAPPALVSDLRDQRPDPSKGISGGSFRMRSNVFSMQLGTFLCATHDVKITSLSLYRPTPGITLTRWGFENEGDKAGSAEVPGSLAKYGPFASHTIMEHCDTAFYYSRVGLEFRRTQPGTQSFLGLRLTYQSDGRQKVGYLWEQYKIIEPRR